MNTTGTLFRRLVPAVGASAAAALAFCLDLDDNSARTTKSAACDDSQTNTSNKKRPKLIFLGTGSSTGCPKPLCTLLFQNQKASTKAQEEFAGICTISNRAIQGDPKLNRDYRNNPSLLISHYNNNNTQQQDDLPKNVVIDVGKTFREGALRWMPYHNIQTLDAIVLTHHHMDAVAGLDDVRGFQRFTGLNRTDRPPTRIPIAVFLSQECLNQVSSQFPWLFPKQASTTSKTEEPVVKRDVAALDVNVIQDYQPFLAAGLKLVPLPVWHGSDLISLGFSFTIQGINDKVTNILYISDISEMIPETLQYIQTKLPPTDILIIDCLLPEFQHPVHYSLEQAVALAQEICAKQTFLVGMSCDAFSSHDEMNRQLQKKYGTIQFAHDGQVVYL